MTVQDETATSTHGVLLTDAAATKAKALLDQEGRDDLALRIAVQPGGCAGLRYNLFFDDRSLDGDLSAEFGGVKLTVDRMSAPYVQGATIDFVDTWSRADPLAGATFIVNSTCAWFGDQSTILSIDVTSAWLYCLRNASLLRLARARSERCSLTASNSPQRVWRATVWSSPFDSASKYS
jgi:iron-sulfur cluster assembly accessory protein